MPSAPFDEPSHTEEHSMSVAKEVLPETESRIVFDLNEFEVETPQFVQESVSELVPTTDYLRNIDVTFELVAPQIQIETPVTQTAQPIASEFEIISSQVREIEVIAPEFVKGKEEEITFSLDLIDTKSVETPVENTVVFDFSNEVNHLNVTEPVQVLPVTEMNENGIIRYSLEEEIEMVAEPVAEVNKVVEPIEAELNFTVKQTEVAFDAPHALDNSPLEMSIEETLKARAEERKRKLKDFNYKFNNPGRIDELEKEPAFKRLGIDVTSMPNQNQQSRMSLGLDSNDDVQLRSNNSFLHDNVD